MNRLKSTPAASKDHPGDDIFAITRLPVMATLYPDNLTCLEVNQLNYHSGGANINSQTIILVCCIASLYLQYSTDTVVPGNSGSDTPLMLGRLTISRKKST